MLSLLFCLSVLTGVLSQNSPCPVLKGKNTTRLRQRRNNTSGNIIAYSEISIFYENGTLIEIPLQGNNTQTRYGSYRVNPDQQSQEVCFIERIIRNEDGNNYTDCETITLTAKSNSEEGAEGCAKPNVTSQNECYRSCRGPNNEPITTDLVAYFINSPINNQTK